MKPAAAIANVETTDKITWKFFTAVPLKLSFSSYVLKEIYSEVGWGTLYEHFIELIIDGDSVIGERPAVVDCKFLHIL